VKNQTDAAALCRGASRSSLQIRRVCGIRESCAAFFVAASVRLHGARPWHPGELRSFLCSGERETPRREAVASVFSWHTTCRVNHQQAWGGITYPERGVPPRHNVPALPFVTNPLSCGPAKYNERTEN